jgi:type 1 glutamine amidotransferase
MSGNFVFRALSIAFVIGLGACASAQLAEQEAKRIEAAVPEKATVEPKKPRRVLIWNTPFMDNCPHKGYSVPQGEYAMRMLGEKTGAFEPVVSDDVAMYRKENLDKFDAIIMNNSNGPWIRPTPEDMDKFKDLGTDIDKVERILRANFLDWLKSGRGVVMYHHAIGGNNQWPAFGEMLGAGYWGHPWNEEIGVKLEEPDHPLLKAFGGKDFRIAEEIFQYNEPYSRENLRVLLSIDVPNTNMTVPWIYRADGDFGLAWVKSYGDGRLFYSEFGHRTETWWDKRILQFYLDGIQFAVGDLLVDTTPSAKVGKGIEPEFKSLFNGKDLTGWGGDPKIWSVVDGLITGRTVSSNQLSENDFLVCTAGDFKDFELRWKVRLERGNTGVYFRGRQRNGGNEPEAVTGPQADVSADGTWSGVILENKLRGVLAGRGEKVVWEKDGTKNVVGSVGDPEALRKHYCGGLWNQCELIAKGGQIVYKINGLVMCELTDNDERMFPAGKIALQVHQGPPMLVQFKDIRIRKL